MGKLTNKVAIITGSSKGIGKGIAVRFAQEGAKVVINSRSEGNETAEALQEVDAQGGEGVVIPADVSQTDELKNLIAATVKHFGKVDVLVNNAGVEKSTPFVEVTEEDYDFVLNVNLKGAFFATQLMARHLIETSRPGSIIMISSVHEDLPFPNFAPYCASKGGMRMLTRTLAIELAEHGIRVNGVAPGAIATPMNKSLTENPEKLKKVLGNIPLKRLGQPEDVAGVAAFLASDDSAYVTGSTYFVDGGLTWNYDE